jgi:hypothetical protein
MTHMSLGSKDGLGCILRANIDCVGGPAAETPKATGSPGGVLNIRCGNAGVDEKHHTRS